MIGKIYLPGSKREKVRGSKEASQPIVVGKDTVYVHSNVRKLTADELRKQNEFLTDEELENIEEYEYDEIQYSISEYIKIMSDKNTELENNITDLEIAITELYEGSVE